MSPEIALSLIRNFWVAFVVSALAARPIMHWLHLAKSRQTISAHAPSTHQVKQGTPTMGGLIVLAGALVAMIVNWNGVANQSLVALILLLGFGAIGFIDDYVVPRMVKGKRGLEWKEKLAMQVVITVIATGVLANWRFDGASAAYVFFILFFSNAYNFSDGLDGLAGSLLLGLGVGFVLLMTLTPSANPTATFLAPVLGGIVPFLFLNAPPARVFMGDVGSLPIGALLGLSVTHLSLPLAAITSGATQTNFALPYEGSPYGLILSLIIPAILLSGVMIAELVPVPLQILSVKLRKKKLFPFTPIHHAFEKAGWPETRVVWMFALLQLLFSILAYSFLAYTLAPKQ